MPLGRHRAADRAEDDRHRRAGKAEPHENPGREDEPRGRGGDRHRRDAQRAATRYVLADAAAALGERTALALALDGGDDYELCCTVPETARSRLAALAGQGGCPLRIIGRIREGRGMTFARGGEPAKAPETVPWSHFDGAEG